MINWSLFYQLISISVTKPLWNFIYSHSNAKPPPPRDVFSDTVTSCKKSETWQETIVSKSAVCALYFVSWIQELYAVRTEADQGHHPGGAQWPLKACWVSERADCLARYVKMWRLLWPTRWRSIAVHHNLLFGGAGYKTPQRETDMWLQTKGKKMLRGFCLPHL